MSFLPARLVVGIWIFIAFGQAALAAMWLAYGDVPYAVMHGLVAFVAAAYMGFLLNARTGT